MPILHTYNVYKVQSTYPVIHHFVGIWGDPKYPDQEECYMLHPDRLSRSTLPTSRSDRIFGEPQFPSPLAAMVWGNFHHLRLDVRDMMAS